MAFLIRDTLLSKQNLGNIFICCVLLLSCSFSSAVESDINCLKSLKATLQDPLGYLKSSWNFNNNTEGFICNFLGIECWHPHESKVLNIKLSDLGLKGPFPHGVANCTSLTGLDLSSNKLSGPLPEDIGRIISFIATLDLSSNSFSGQIPTNITNCSYLNVLKLDSNLFTGNIPLGLGQLSRIKIFSVANNQLSGQVPAFGNNSVVTIESYANNAKLCGEPLKPCRSSQVKSTSTLVKVLKSNSVVIAAAAGFGFAFPFSFCFFLPRAPSVRRLWVFYRGYKLR
ncbi:probably inactive leucine-rich repeat receptor-like protein kinase At5g48380 isoform X1 [Pyrus x bretschneideri]|uniref:probably inactive leucine-rich repeat receptor-like protein kinase At5g48380 isoform X1 n=1 Tax=Pyrus x bretschneideri TaxID=225117 RepID=UPI00202ECFDC|nr:probably inactive leucine-rich repeat receptor-like protein kinase At5g48380 isoform X1 [Pyrus x bretschneideri]XP_048429811.1 probably inactive leucine-rich repeat receptor-like protein kinase At5g48380 isoform X1 [Pyrus x bretschneideri]XP_048429812.1 probably inactive leucine-rich repeat receptor-like protein kinase At5g48380 isoform X1 [Pyrus x bretschneideri]XP_048429813.1 probably inactive leucine-rich repeat receptor-like protein kinase At5g48380 isoform X1 [Pyrus x bretschneideri]XP_